jgi:hypothetical protein
MRERQICGGFGNAYRDLVDIVAIYVRNLKRPRMEGLQKRVGYLAAVPPYLQRTMDVRVDPNLVRNAAMHETDRLNGYRQEKRQQCKDSNAENRVKIRREAN